jgi:hypothetical protein
MCRDGAVISVLTTDERDKRDFFIPLIAFIRGCSELPYAFM